MTITVTSKRSPTSEVIRCNGSVFFVRGSKFNCQKLGERYNEIIILNHSIALFHKVISQSISAL